MADADIQIPVTGSGDAGPKKVDTRTVGAGADEHRQVVVVGDPSTAAAVASVTAADGLDVDVTRVQGTVTTSATLQTGDNTAGRVKITDGTTIATVRELGTNDAMNVAIVDASGNQIVTFSGTGGTSAADDADFVQTTTLGTPAQGVYESTPTSVTDNDMGIIGIDASRRVKVSIDASTLDVAHDAVDSGAPVKTGARATNALPTAVANNDRANNVSDLFGRLLVAHVDPGMVSHINKTYTTQQTGTDLWDPSASKKIAVTSVIIGTYGTTSGRIILWFGDNADTTFSQDTDQVLVAASFAPSATVKPGLVFTPATPVFCTTADREIHITSDAAISFDVTIEGYEWA